MTPSEQIDKLIAGITDWRGKELDMHSDGSVLAAGDAAVTKTRRGQSEEKAAGNAAFTASLASFLKEAPALRRVPATIFTAFLDAGEGVRRGEGENASCIAALSVSSPASRATLAESP